MTTEPKEGAASGADCPFCAAWAAWKKSDAAQHVRGVERESLLLVRSLLESCIRALEGQRSGKS